MKTGLSAYKALKSSWLPLMVKRFRCGHEKTPANTVICAGKKEVKRCRVCHLASGKKWAEQNREYHKKYQRERRAA